LNYMRASNVMCWFFLKFQKLYQLFFKPAFNLLCKISQFVLLWKRRLKVGQKHLIWNFHSYVAFWKGLGHSLMNQTQAMHFSIIFKKTCFGCQIWVYWKLNFEGLHIVIIQKFKFQKLCIKVHNGSNIVTHHLNCLIWKLYNISQSNKFSINRLINESNNIH
jgi:hypothetical protein